MYRLFDSFRFTLERLWQHRVLVTWALVGLSAVTTLALSVMLYVDAVNTRLLSSRLSDPPYAFRFRYLGSWNGTISRADVETADGAIANRFTDVIGLPLSRMVNYRSGGAWSASLANRGALGAFNVGSLSGADAQMMIVAGEWPVPLTVENQQPLPVLVSETTLYAMGLSVDDVLTISRPGGKTITVRIAAFWRPSNAADRSWLFPPKYFDNVLLMQADDLWGILEGIERPVEETAWYLLFDGAGVRTSDVSGLLERMTEGERGVTAALPGIRLDLSPRDGLNAFSAEVNELTQQLVIMILPVGGLVLYFVTLVAGLLVSRQRQEDVILTSRGMSRRAILGLHTQMWLLLVGIALIIGIMVCPLTVQLVGRTTSFLRFESSDTLTLVFTPQVLAAGAITGLLAGSSGLFLAWRGSGQTITRFKQATNRATRAWWQQIYLDVLLLIPACYVLYLLWQQGGLKTTADNPFSDPLTFVGPTLFSFGLTLLFMRLWPFVLRLFSMLIAYSRGIALLMALRELTRSIGRYRGTLLMMCFTLSLTGFTASMASTLDRSLKDTVDYRTGADAVIITTADTQTESSTDSASGQTTYTVTGYNTLPIDDLQKVDGITTVSRVGRYPGQIVLPTARVQGTILGIDRAAIADVARFRSDYADATLAELANRLAGNRTGVLLSEQTAADYSLRIGQEITVQISALGSWYETKVPIAGLLDYFPTLDPGAGFFLLTNLDPLFETVGTNLPYDLWLSLDADASHEQVRQDVMALGYPILDWIDPQTAVRSAQAEPARRGVLGFLSIGFVASIFLTLVGTVIQSSASFRAQAMQLGSLRAMGLGGQSVGAYLIMLQTIAAGSGILSGTSIGIATTLLFLPLLDFSGGLPPYLVRVAWGDITVVYVAFAGVLFCVSVFTALFLGRERLSAVVKLGDA